MAVQKIEVEVSKDISEVMVLVVELVKDLKAKKEADLVLAENIQNLMVAIEGIDQIKADIEQHRAAAINSAVLGAASLVDALTA